MQPLSSRETELLKKILEPLLDDFQDWFSRSRSLLESERITFLSDSEQNDILDQIKQSQEEVKTALILFKVTDREAGIDPQVLLSWHKLVTQCWGIAHKWRNLKNPNQN